MGHLPVRQKLAATRLHETVVRRVAPGRYRHVQRQRSAGRNIDRRVGKPYQHVSDAAVRHDGRVVRRAYGRAVHPVQTLATHRSAVEDQLAVHVFHVVERHHSAIGDRQRARDAVPRRAARVEHQVAPIADSNLRAAEKSLVPVDRAVEHDRSLADLQRCGVVVVAGVVERAERLRPARARSDNERSRIAHDNLIRTMAACRIDGLSKRCVEGDGEMRRRRERCRGKTHRHIEREIPGRRKTCVSKRDGRIVTTLGEHVGRICRRE